MYTDFVPKPSIVYTYSDGLSNGNASNYALLYFSLEHRCATAERAGKKCLLLNEENRTQSVSNRLAYRLLTSK